MAKLSISHVKFSDSHSGAGLTNTISTSEYLNSDDRPNLLKRALSGRGFSGSHNEEAVNFAISYINNGLKPIVHDGLIELDTMISAICEKYKVRAFRLWYDEIYTSNREAHHMTSQDWVEHGLTPYAFNFVLVVGGESVAHNSKRAWVCSEVAAAKVHKGYVFCSGRSTAVLCSGEGRRWNSEIGRHEARLIYQQLDSGKIKCYSTSDRINLRNLMWHRSGY